MLRRRVAEFSNTSLAKCPGPLHSVAGRGRARSVCVDLCSHHERQELCLLGGLFGRLAERASACQLTLPNFSTLAWAFGAAGVADVKLLTRIGDAVRTRSGDLD